MDIKELPQYYHQITAQLESEPVYLVGGAVRDVLLGRAVHDLDFTLPESTIKAAKKVADQLGGDFFLLDEERRAVRVILDDYGKRRVVDFTAFQGGTIEDDLRSRDFTITSLAVSIQQPDQLIDPCGGREDLSKGIIRSCTDRSLQEDPLRAVRAVRMAAQLEFQIERGTTDQIRRTVASLKDVSPERLRDEIIRILDGPHQAAAFQILSHLGILKSIFPEAEQDFDFRIRLLKELEAVWKILDPPFQPDLAASWEAGLISHRLGRFRDQLSEYAGEEIVPGRTHRHLTFFAALHLPPVSVDKKSYFRPENDFQFSNREWTYVQQSLSSTLEYLGGPLDPDQISDLDIYRFFKAFPTAGISGLMLALAHMKADMDRHTKQDNWPAVLESIRTFWQAYWEKNEQLVNPPVLVNGHDLLETFQLEPGPEIGKLLERVREAQAAGLLNSKDQALSFIRGILIQETADEKISG